MIVAIYCTLLGAGCLALAFLLWRERNKQRVVPLDELPPATRRFRVIASTDDGGKARRFFEKIKPPEDGAVEFWDGPARRGNK